MNFLRIPIDHIYADQSLMVHAAWLGSPIGSDHLPTLAIFGRADTQNIDK